MARMAQCGGSRGLAFGGAIRCCSWVPSCGLVHGLAHEASFFDMRSVVVLFFSPAAEFYPPPPPNLLTTNRVQVLRAYRPRRHPLYPCFWFEISIWGCEDNMWGPAVLSEPEKVPWVSWHRTAMICLLLGGLHRLTVLSRRDVAQGRSSRHFGALV